MHKTDIIMMTDLINGAFTMKQVPSIWKVSEIIMIYKSGMSPNELKFGRHCQFF